MITVLVVGPESAEDLQPPASLELLRADSSDEAIETLSRNRRIDAVLFLDGELARQTLALLSEEGGAWPPLFQSGGPAEPGIRALEPGTLLEDVLRNLL